MSKIFNQYGAADSLTAKILERKTRQFVKELLQVFEDAELDPIDRHLAETVVVSTLTCELATERIRAALHSRRNKHADPKDPGDVPTPEVPTGPEG
jgi:hypothetical protein